MRFSQAEASGMLKVLYYGLRALTRDGDAGLKAVGGKRTLNSAKRGIQKLADSYYRRVRGTYDEPELDDARKKIERSKWLT
jgi:hypothetical protein